MTLPAGVTDEMVEAAIVAYEDMMFDLHSNAFRAGDPIDVRSMRDASMRAALTDALAGSVVMPAEQHERLIAALEFIRDGYERIDVNHVDFRVGAYKAALDALGTADLSPSPSPGDAP